MSYGKGISYMNKQKPNIVLFDMDGTLTEARRPIGMPMIKVLRELISQNERAHIGVVTGSDLDYVKQQMKPLFEKDYDLARQIHWMPCNGTKRYKFNGSDWEVLHSVDMRTHLGEQQFINLMQKLSEQQHHIAALRIPLTGHFVNYRGSMINWCPIGRNANHKDREEFMKLDKSYGRHSLREEYLIRLQLKTSMNPVVCKLGGDTSFDIYPKGWDKTYCLKYFEGYNIYFIGDRCHQDGNDFEIFKKLQPHSWSTNSPTNTIRIINEQILHLIS